MDVGFYARSSQMATPNLPHTHSLQILNITANGSQEKTHARLIAEYVHKCCIEKLQKVLFGTPERKCKIISRKGQEHPLVHIRPAKSGILSPVVDNVQQAASSFQQTLSNTVHAVSSFFKESLFSSSDRPSSFFGIVHAEARTITQQIPSINLLSANDIIPLNSTSTQYDPDVTVLSDNTLVAVWTVSSIDSNTYARFFDFTGQPVGDMFKIFNSLNSTQVARVLPLSNNRLIAICNNHTGDDHKIFGQIFNKQQQEVGSRFQINDNSVYLENTYPSIASLHNGGFVVSWLNSSRSIYYRIYDDTPNPISLGSINIVGATVLGSTTIKGLPNGGFVIYWRNYSYVPGLGSLLDNSIQFYNSIGQPTSPQILVNNANGAFPTNVYATPGLTVLKDRIAVTCYNCDGMVEGHLLDFAGNKMGDMFQIAPSSSGFTWRYSNCAQVSDNKNLWVAVYQTYGQGVESGGTNFSWVMKLFNQNGKSLGKKLVFTNTFSTAVLSPKITSISNNRFAVVWGEGSTKGYIRIFEVRQTGTVPYLYSLSETDLQSISHSDGLRRSKSELDFSTKSESESDSDASTISESGSDSDMSTISEPELDSDAFTISESELDSDMSTISKSDSDTEGRYSTSNSTFTRKQTKTLSHPLSPNTSIGSVIVSTLALQNISSSSLSPSGNYLLTIQGNALSLISIAADDTMSIQSTLGLNIYPMASCFSADEKQFFVADTQGNIYAIDLTMMKVTQTFTVPELTTLEMGPNGDLFVGTHNGMLEVDTSGNILHTISTNSPVTSIKSFRKYIVMSAGNQASIISLDGRQLQVIKTFQLSDTETISEMFALKDSGTVIAQTDGQSIVINATNVANAFIQGSLTTGEGTRLALSEEHMVSKGKESGALIYQKGSQGWISDQAVGFIPTHGETKALAFSPDGTFGIIIDGQGVKKFRVINTQGRLDVPLFRRTNTIPTDTSLQKVLFNQRKNLCILGGERVVQLMSSDNFANPTNLGSIAIESIVEDMVFFPDKTTLIISDDKQNVVIANLFDPENPQVLGTYKAAYPVKSMTLYLNQLLLCEANHGIEFVDVTDPSHMIHQEEWKTNGRASQVIYNVMVGNEIIHIVADGSNGVDIYDNERNLLSNIEATGSASHVVLSPDKQTLYVADGRVLRQVFLDSPFSIKPGAELSFDGAIEDISISNSGDVAYVVIRGEGVFAVNTQTMRAGTSLFTDDPKSIAFGSDDTSENQILIANADTGTLVVSDLISSLPLVAVTPDTEFNVGMSAKEKVQFYDAKTLKRQTVTISSVSFVVNGVAQSIPYWISRDDLMNGVININPPAEFTGQSFVIVFSGNVQGVMQEIPYTAKVSSSLHMQLDSGQLVIKTPSERIAMTATLEGDATFIPMKIDTGADVTLLQNGKGVSVVGSTDNVNAWLKLQRVTNYKATVSFDVDDWYNIYPFTGTYQADVFALNEPPLSVVSGFSMQIANPLDPFIMSCKNLFKDADNDDLSFTLSDIPKGLTFDSKMCELSGVIDKSLAGQKVNFSVAATDGHASTLLVGNLVVNEGQLPTKLGDISKIIVNTGENKELTINCFEDPMNHTLSISLSSSDGNDLPSFCTWNPLTNKLSINPQVGSEIFTNPLGDVGDYTLMATAINELGGNTSTSFSIQITLSKEDLTTLILSYIGIAGSLIGVSTALFQWRTVLALYRHVFRRKSYWREKMPLELCEGKIYYPTDPVTSTKISKKKIQSIQVFRLNQEGFHLWRNISTYLEYNKEKKPLLTGDTPNYLKISDGGGVSIDFEALKKSQQEITQKPLEALFLQVTGKDDRILELFEIDLEQLRSYQNTVEIDLNITDVPSDNDEKVPLVPLPVVQDDSNEEETTVDTEPSVLDTIPPADKRNEKNSLDPDNKLADLSKAYGANILKSPSQEFDL